MYLKKRKNLQEEKKWRTISLSLTKRNKILIMRMEIRPRQNSNILSCIYVCMYVPCLNVGMVA